jgi:hypothetical protein
MQNTSSTAFTAGGGSTSARISSMSAFASASAASRAGLPCLLALLLRSGVDLHRLPERRGEVTIRSRCASISRSIADASPSSSALLAPSPSLLVFEYFPRML